MLAQRSALGSSAAVVALSLLLAACGGGGAANGSSGAGAATGSGGSGGAGVGSGGGGGGVVLPPCPAEADALYQTMLDQFTQRLADEGVPGGAVALVCGGTLRHADGVGVTQQGGPDVTADTRFQWASSTKMLTAATAVLLAQDGTVDLQAPVTQYVPSLGYPQMTLHHLLSHTGAYPTQWHNFVSTDLGPTVLANATLPLWAEPGTLHVYSNTGFSVAGYVLEASAGQPFAQLVSERLFVPAGMTATFDINEVLAGPYAFGHTPTGPVAPDGSYLHHGVYGPMGGAWGSIVDFARWAELHAQAAFPMSPELLALLRGRYTMTGIPATDYGYGHYVQYSQPQVIHHGGSAVGYRADWRAVPELGLAVVMLVNADWTLPADLSLDLLSALAEPTFPEWPSFGTHADYVGSYLDPIELGAIEVTSDGTDLTVEFVDSGLSAVATHGYGDVYFFSSGNVFRDLHFWRPDHQGQATHIASRFGIAARVNP